MLVALISGVGALVHHRESIMLELGIEGVHPDYYRAIDMAKSARILDRYHTNQWTMSDRIENEGGTLDPNGWKAERQGGDLFLVTYRMKIGDRTVEYDFEVHVGARDVFVRRDDPNRPEPNERPATAGR